MSEFFSQQASALIQKISENAEQSAVPIQIDQGMGVFLRIVLIIGSLCTAFLMLSRIRKAKIQIKDSIFWILFSFMILILSIFPQIATWASDFLGILSPINFVYLFMIFILLVHEFFMSVRISQMDSKIKQLTQQVALQEKEKQEQSALSSCESSSSNENNSS